MENRMITQELANRELDVTSIENALIDLLVRASEGVLSEMNLTKGVMRLVDTTEQGELLKRVGNLAPEVEVGGSASNVLRALAVLGGRASYSSVVGRDTYGHSFASRLEELSIRNRLVMEPGETGTCAVIVTPDGERTLNTHLGACVYYDEHHVPVDDIANSKVFFTTGYVWDTPNQKRAIRKAITHARESGCLVALDVADPFVIDRAGQELTDMLKGSVDIAFANSVESKMLTGASGEEGARRLGQWVRVAVVKDGPDGSYVCFEGRTQHIPAPSVEVLDTTGAGDFYAGGFLFGLCRGLPFGVCGAIGTVIASDTVTHLGVRHSLSIFSRIRTILKDAGHNIELVPDR
jgi:sugar/nucleoside kinase (ribokinase family)